MLSQRHVNVMLITVTTLLCKLLTSYLLLFMNKCMTNCSLTEMITSKLIVKVMKRAHNFLAEHSDISFLSHCNVRHAPQPSITLSK